MEADNTTPCGERVKRGLREKTDLRSKGGEGRREERGREDAASPCQRSIKGKREIMKNRKEEMKENERKNEHKEKRKE